MKKVICVDEDVLSLTVGKKYPVIIENEGSYTLINDAGNENTYLKRYFRPVPEAEYQYGQEVEGEYKGQDKKGKFIATVSLLDGQIRHIIQNPKEGELLDICTSIRPIQSMRDKVIELLYKYNCSFEDQHGRIADRILLKTKRNERGNEGNRRTK